MVNLILRAPDGVSFDADSTWAEVFPKASGNRVKYILDSVMEIELGPKITIGELNDAVYHIQLAGIKTKVEVSW